MKLQYDRFFARMLTFAKLGKNLVFVAEQSDETENRSDGKGGTINVKTGVKPNMPKGSKFDFDVVVNTYTKDGKSYGKVEKDRTKTFAIGDVVEMPNYSYWEAAIARSKQGTAKTKDDIKTFDEMMESESENLNNGGDNNITQANALIQQISSVITALPTDKQKVVAGKFTETLGSPMFKNEKDKTKLEKYLEIAKSVK
jgi:hypothetical protein